MRHDLEQAIDAIAAEHVSAKGPGFAVLVGRNDKVLLQKGYGLADLRRCLPITPDSRFLIASVTKQFTAMGVQLLKHRGFLEFDDPIAKFFPEFSAYGDTVTIRHLLTHTSGIKEYLSSKFWREGSSESHRSLKALIDSMAEDSQLDFAPGSRWRYCNFGYVLLGALIERISGVGYADFMADNIFRPLGMTSTLVGTSAVRSERQAVGYVYKSRDECPEAPYTFERVGWADGNIIATVGDLFLWSQALYTEALLPRAELAAAFVPVNPLNQAFTRYGFGQLIGERRGVRVIHHTGGTGGYSSKLMRFTDERLTIVVLSNAEDIDITNIAGAMADVLLEDKLAPFTPIVLPRTRLAEKQGTYREEYGSGTTVLRLNDQGELSLSGEATYLTCPRASLVPLSPTLFRLADHSDMYVSFQLDNGIATGCRILAAGSVQSFVRAD